MSEQADLHGIREFLEGLGIVIREVNFGFQAFVMDTPMVNAQTELGICRGALGLFLSTQLGIHWRGIYPLVLEQPILFEATRKQIRQAIDYLETLGKGE